MNALELANLVLFLSTLSLRRATPSLCFFWRRFCHFYPRSPCGERPYVIRYPVNLHPISIHALLAESDPSSIVIVILRTNFYPRSPCGERLVYLALIRYLINFYPRSPCGERRTPTTVVTLICISIHALLAESDLRKVPILGIK